MTIAPTRIAAGLAAFVAAGSLLAGCSSASTTASSAAAGASSAAKAATTTTTTSAAATTAATTPTAAAAASTAAAPAASSAAATGLTMAAVATHNSASSCWTVIDKNVYDLTAWISVHPGGATPIKGLCGIDGTAQFHAEHGTESSPAKHLATFLKGALAG